MAARCPHCDRAFHPTRGLFGQPAEALRDAHAAGCEQNPANRCFCGKVFPSSAARDNHAALCEANPANRYRCRHCPREFLSSFGVLGYRSADGRALRDAHEVGCKSNPANICFCGEVFCNPDARNAHAVTCEMNPANCYECSFCSVTFVTHFTVFGFRSVDGKALRDAHQLCCERNPRNICFCGRLFSSAAARDKHAAICELNPANRFECRHCRSMFVTRYGMMGMVTSNGQSLRAAHEVGCEKNPANRCFCGQVFPSPDRRDAHAAVCEMNPVNRFTCQHCDTVCVTSHGLFVKCGSEKLSAHLQVCPKNPANSACEHCGATFSNAQDMRQGWFCGDAKSRCRAHEAVCTKNPRNQFSCRKCDRCFQNGRRWLRRVDGRLARDAHESECDLMPCPFKMADSGCQDWVLLAANHTPEAVGGAALETGQDWEDCGLLAVPRSGADPGAKVLGGLGTSESATSMGCSSSTTVSGDWLVEDEEPEHGRPGGAGPGARGGHAAAMRRRGSRDLQPDAQARGPPGGHGGPGADDEEAEEVLPGGFFDAVSEAGSWDDLCGGGAPGRGGGEEAGGGGPLGAEIAGAELAHAGSTSPRRGSEDEACEQVPAEGSGGEAEAESPAGEHERRKATDEVEAEEAQEEADEWTDEGDDGEDEAEEDLVSQGSMEAQSAVPLAKEGRAEPASDDDAEAMAEKHEEDEQGDAAETAPASGNCEAAEAFV